MQTSPVADPSLVVITGFGVVLTTAGVSVVGCPGGDIPTVPTKYPTKPAMTAANTKAITAIMIRKSFDDSRAIFASSVICITKDSNNKSKLQSNKHLNINSTNLASLNVFCHTTMINKCHQKVCS